MLGAFDPSAFDAARPTAFYFEDEDMVDSADAFWVCTGGVELPVHSQVVSLRSTVLRGAFRALRENDQAEAAEPATRKRPREEPLARPPLRLPFDNCPLKAVVVFLRFLYQPEAVTPANLGSLGDLLPAVARLAHKFNVARVMACVEEWLLQPDQARTAEQLEVSLDLAETLQLDNLHSNTLLSIAKQLVKPLDARGAGVSSVAAFMDVAKLGLGEGDRLRLLAVLTSALRSAPGGVRDQVFLQLPPQGDMVELGRLQGTTGVFTWDVPGFSLEQRHHITSPVFSAGGHSWSLSLDPHRAGEVGEAVAIFLFLSGFQEGGRGVEAAARLTVVSTAGVSISATTDTHLFKVQGWGFPAFAPRELITNPANGFLVNDTLRIKAEVVC